jgi:hypothetical protein
VEDVVDVFEGLFEHEVKKGRDVRSGGL